MKNVPESCDEQHIEMFFAYEKGQGGGVVNHVTLNETNHTAIVEFVNADSVDVVMNKRPIKIMGSGVDVEPYSPYLNPGEFITSVHIEGIDRELSDDLRMRQECDSKVGITDDQTAELQEQTSEEVRMKQMNNFKEDNNDRVEEEEATEPQPDGTMAKRLNVTIEELQERLEKLKDEWEGEKGVVSEKTRENDKMQENLSQLMTENEELKKKLLERESQLAEFDAAKQPTIEMNANGDGDPTQFPPAPNPYIHLFAPPPPLARTSVISSTFFYPESFLTFFYPESFPNAL